MEKLEVMWIGMLTLLWLLRHLPLLPVPRDSGLRQPIHARQLAALVFHLSHQLACSSTQNYIGTY